jgi:hypothetical protein
LKKKKSQKRVSGVVKGVVQTPVPQKKKKKKERKRKLRKNN